VGEAANWEVKPAQIYATLARLEEAGLVEETAVEQDAGPEKRIYALTPAGRAELTAWFSTGVKREHQRDEFYLKLMLCLATGEADPRQVIQTQRVTFYQDLHALVTQRSQANPQTELAQILLLDQAVMHLEADLRWLDMIEARLDEVRRQPLPEPEARPRGRPRGRRGSGGAE